MLLINNCAYSIRKTGIHFYGIRADPRQGTSKGLPATLSPHKKRTPQAPDASVTGGGPTQASPAQATSVDLPSSDAATVDVSIVVPVRNEAENVAPLIAEIVSALGGRWSYEIIYVNDGSTDATAERLAAIMQQRPNLRQLRHANSTGQSAAVRSGGLAAGQRVGRKDTGFKKMQSRIANAVRSAILSDGTRDTGCGLKAFPREAF